MTEQDTVAADRRPPGESRGGARSNPTMPPTDHAIRTESLVREFDGDRRRRRRRPADPRRARSTDSSGPTAPGSRRPYTCCAPCSPPPAAGPWWPATTSGTEPGQVRLRIGVALQEAALDPKQTGTELLRLQGRLYGLTRSEVTQRVAELAELIDLGDFLDRADRDLLGRDEAPARPGRRPHPQPGDRLPRRADHRPRPGEPGPGVGRGPAAQRRARA